MMMRPFVGGVGVILTLHHVRPPRFGAFQPNRLLEVSPEFFSRMVRRLRRSRIDLVTLDEMYRRLTEGDFGKRFACLTFDDGYRDFLEHAQPVLRKYEVPFAMYVPTSFPDRIGELWWLGLEAVIANNARIGLLIDGRERRFDCRNAREKRDLFDQLYWWLRARKTEEELRAMVRDLCGRYGVDMKAICEKLCMTWTEVTELAHDPLATIGAHTVNHVILSKVSEQAVRAEMEMGRSVLEAAIGVRPRHLAYPVGDSSSASEREFRIAREVGFKTAVTTQPGVLFPAHRDHLMALPRISVNGEFQQMRYLKVLMSGAPTALMSGFRRVKAA
jgi:peptidoglycan/xylan/chitin deacetylase (PgdA/CDA1 family)